MTKGNGPAEQLAKALAEAGAPDRAREVATEMIAQVMAAEGARVADSFAETMIRRIVRGRSAALFQAMACMWKAGMPRINPREIRGWVDLIMEAYERADGAFSDTHPWEWLLEDGPTELAEGRTALRLLDAPRSRSSRTAEAIVPPATGVRSHRGEIAVILARGIRRGVFDAAALEWIRRTAGGNANRVCPATMIAWTALVAPPDGTGAAERLDAAASVLRALTENPGSLNTAFTGLHHLCHRPGVSLERMHEIEEVVRIAARRGDDCGEFLEFFVPDRWGRTTPAPRIRAAVEAICDLRDFIHAHGGVVSLFVLVTLYDWWMISDRRPGDREGRLHRTMREVAEAGADPCIVLSACTDFLGERHWNPAPLEAVIAAAPRVARLAATDGKLGAAFLDAVAHGAILPAEPFEPLWTSVCRIARKGGWRIDYILDEARLAAPRVGSFATALSLQEEIVARGLFPTAKMVEDLHAAEAAGS